MDACSARTRWVHLTRQSAFFLSISFAQNASSRRIRSAPWAPNTISGVWPFRKRSARLFQPAKTAYV